MNNQEIIAECKNSIESFFCKPRSSMKLQDAVEKINDVYEILDMDSKNNGWSITTKDGLSYSNITMNEAVAIHREHTENE